MSFLNKDLSFQLRDIGSLIGRGTTKFIILGTARTGSTLLRGLLNSHSDIIAFGELFRSKEEIGWDLMPYQKEMQSSQLSYLHQHEPVSFLEEVVFQGHSRKVKAVGFKIFYYQAQDTQQKLIWSWLIDHKKIKVIHIKRRNYLETLLSLTRAHKTNKWYKSHPADNQDEDLSIELPPEKCLNYFTWLEETSAQYDTLFQNHQKIDVYYEDLVAAAEAEMQVVQKFLRVKHQHLVPSTLKQASQPLSQAILNYAELKQQLKDTPWSTFFEE
jgi:LPS sulfotransferase NodH